MIPEDNSSTSTQRYNNSGTARVLKSSPHFPHQKTTDMAVRLPPLRLWGFGPGNSCAQGSESTNDAYFGHQSRPCFHIGLCVGPAQTAEKKKTRPRPNSKNKHPKRPNSKKINTTLPLPHISPRQNIHFQQKNTIPPKQRCLGGVRVFLLFGPGGRVYFLLFGRAGERACLFCLLFGLGTGVHSLTGLPGSSLRGPTTKKDQTTAKKKHGF